MSFVFATMRYPHIHNRTRKPSSIKGHTSNRDLDGVYDDDGEVFKDKAMMN